MGFNLKKMAQKAKNSVLPISVGLENNTEEHKLSLVDKSHVSNYDVYLDDTRKSTEEKAVTHEAMLDEARKRASVSDKITEGSLEDVDSKLYPHRQFKNGEDDYQVSPIDATSQAFDSKFRDAFSKANKDSDTAFWDKYVGDQLDDKQNKVSSNVPDSGSQLQNNPARFGKLDNLPIDPKASKNRDKRSTEIDVKPMHGFAGGEKGLKMAVASLKDADGLLFGIYFKAAKENRELNSYEKELVNGINKDKSNILLALAQVDDKINALNARPGFVPEEGNVPVEDRGTDFLNENDPTAGDPALWASMSGHNPNATDLDYSDVGGEGKIPSPEELSSDISSNDNTMVNNIDTDFNESNQATTPTTPAAPAPYFDGSSVENKGLLDNEEPPF